MPSLFSSKPEFGIIFDIGPSSVGAGLVRFKKSDVPQVIYATREIFPLRETVDASRFFDDMVLALKQANQKILKESAGLKIAHVMYALATPWSAVKTKTLSIKGKKPFVVTKKFLDGIIAEQGLAFEKSALGPSLNLSDRLSLIEKRVLDMKFDGQTMPSPYLSIPREVELSLFFGLAPKLVLNEISDTAIKTYHPKDTKISSFSLVGYSMIRDMFHDAHDFISLTIGGEVSDVSLVREDLIVSTVSFPLGSHFLIREVAQAFKTSLGEAESILSLYFKGHGSEVTADKVEAVLSIAQSRYVDALNAVMDQISPNSALPRNIFAIIDGTFTDFFIKMLQANPSLDVTLINPEKLRHLVIFFPRVEKDPFIALIAAFINKSHILDSGVK